MYQLYQRVAPRPEDFRLLDKIGQSMAVDYDFTEEVRALQVPTMIVAADADMCPPSHFVEVFKLLDGGLRDGGWMAEGRPAGGHALAILPGVTHYNIFASPLLALAIEQFLRQLAPKRRGRARAAGWAGTIANGWMTRSRRDRRAAPVGVVGPVPEGYL